MSAQSLPRPHLSLAPLVRIADRMRNDAARDRAELVDGLRSTPAAIAPRYFYDPLGCALFGAICELPEYYLTRTERAIFEAHREEIARTIGRGRQWIDVGAGDCAKGEAWIPAVRPSRYVAVDIARAAIEGGLSRISREHAGLDVAGVVTDFAHGLDIEADLHAVPALFFYPGSSIGNFDRVQALRFLAGIHRLCAARPGSGLLIGVDTRKEADVLEAAYDDALGVTAAFNRNVLHHVNRILGCDFDPSMFAHRARYDRDEGRIEMHLEAMRDVVVQIDGVARRFGTGERIHTENSFKYGPEQFAELLRQAGFASLRCWQDAHQSYAVFYAA